jgi:hypothetical protein
MPGHKDKAFSLFGDFPMTTLHHLAVRYFEVAHCRDSFWRWDLDTKGIIWADGATVASRDEIVNLLLRLDPRGVPPIGAIAHLYAGCRGKRIHVQWGTPTENEIVNKRVPHNAMSCGVEHMGCNRVRMFTEPEAISNTLEWLSRIPAELGDVLTDPPAIENLLTILITDDYPRPYRFFTGGIEAELALGHLTAQELNAGLTYKYSSFISDLAIASRMTKCADFRQLRTRLAQARIQRTA